MGADRGDASFRTNGTSPSRRHSAAEPVTRHYRRAAPRGAGIEESPASAFLSSTFSLAATPSPAPLMGAGRGGGDALFRTNGTSPSRRHSATAVVTRHYRRAAPRGAGIEESPASAFLSSTFSLADTPSPAPLMGAGRGGGDASFRTNGTSPSRRHSAAEPVTRHYSRTAPHPNPPPQRGAGIEENPARAFLRSTFSLADTPSP